MKIISKYKDYYDYVAHEYGGGDPKLVYLRKPLPEGSKFIPLGPIGRIAWRYLPIETVLEHIYVCGTRYLAIDGTLALLVKDKDKYKKYFKQLKSTDLVDTHISYNLIHKELAAPVFSNHCLEIPNLGNYGFGSIISPIQMYQNIAMFLAEIRPMMEMPELSDKEKVLTHGFDKTISFRNRK